MPFNQLCLPWPWCVCGGALSEWIIYQSQLSSSAYCFCGRTEAIEIFLKIVEFMGCYLLFFFHECCGII